MEFKDLPKVNAFDKWLMEEPYRLERYYHMVEGMTDSERKYLRNIFENIPR